MHEAAKLQFGEEKWRRVLGWKGNFICGLRIYERSIDEPAQGKHATFPSDSDNDIRWLIDNGYLKPTRFAPDPKRAPWVGLIGYNAAYIKGSLSHKPLAGHYVDWDYEVLAEGLDRVDRAVEDNVAVTVIDRKGQEVTDTMALAKKAGTTATATPTGNRVVSINRETFVRGGLRDDFKGVTANSAYFPWLANKKQHEEIGTPQQWRLALTFDIYPDEAGENEEPERAIYGVADLKYFVPSNDGQNPAGASDQEYLDLATSGGEIDDAEMYRGMLPIYIGTSKNPKHGFLPLGTNFEFLEAKLEECFEAAGIDAAGRLVPGLDPSDARQFDGLYCHWNRLPVPGRTMRVDTSGKGNVKAGDVLVPTEFIERRAPDAAPTTTAASPKTTATATTTTIAKPATAATATGKVELQVDEALQEEIAGDVLMALTEAEGGKTKNDLVKILLPSYADKTRRTGLLLCLNSIPWLAADDKTWTYDGDTGLLSL